MPTPAAMLETYRRAVYTVAAPDGEVRFSLAPAITGDARVSLPFSEPWAFITAYNPRSRTVPDAVNRRAHEKLIARLGALALQSHPARGESPGGDPSWTEHGVLVSARRAVILDLLREFGQNAAVFCEHTRVGLLMLDGAFIETGAYAPRTAAATPPSRPPPNIRPS